MSEWETGELVEWLRTIAEIIENGWRRLERVEQLIQERDHREDQITDIARLLGLDTTWSLHHDVGEEVIAHLHATNPQPTEPEEGECEACLDTGWIEGSPDDGATLHRYPCPECQGHGTPDTPTEHPAVEHFMEALRQIADGVVDILKDEPDRAAHVRRHGAARTEITRAVEALEHGRREAMRERVVPQTPEALTEEEG